MFAKLFGQKARPTEAPEITRPTSDSAKAEAKANPGGWVYEIGGGYNNEEAVPPQAIKGAWKVDDNGEISGEYKPNPNFDPNFRKPGA